MSSVAGPDFGKQIGPLPLGAWVVVVAGGLGIAVYTRRSNGPAVAEIVDNTSGDAGVGTGAVGGFIPTSPAPTGSTPVAVPTTNDEWGQMVERGLIARNYPPSTVDSMVRKYVAGQTSSMSPAEYALLGVALATYSGPPQTLPPDNDGPPPTTTPPPSTTPPVTIPKPARYVSTGKFGLAAGHPVSVVYLTATGYLRPGSRGLVFTGKGGTPKGHPWSYAYASGIGFVRKVG